VGTHVQPVNIVQKSHKHVCRKPENLRHEIRHQWWRRPKEQRGTATATTINLMHKSTNFLTARQFNPARYFRTNFAALYSTRGNVPRTIKIPLYNAKTFKSTCSLNADVIRLAPPPIGERTIVIIYTAPKCQISQ